MTKTTLWLATAGFLALAAPALASDNALDGLTPEQLANIQQFEASLHPAKGTISVPGAHARLNLGDAYYFLPADEAQKILINWGNPPDSVDDVLGIVFPTGRHFYDNSWAAVITYQDTGHIDDKDAANEDYDKVLADMRKGEAEANEQARKDGYPGSQTIGWAQPPTYDAAGRTLIWARDLKFDETDVDTLNYDVRKLARTGVLSLNMVDTMPHLEEVQTAAWQLGQTVVFEDGQTYADFKPGSDKMADFGLAGLVALGGAAAAKKLGLLAILIAFLKKGVVIVIAAFAGGWKWLKRKFGSEA